MSDAVRARNICTVLPCHVDDRRDFVGMLRSVNTRAILRNVLPDACSCRMSL